MVLVDAQDREVGIEGKLETHRRGLLHRAFSVIVWDSAGRQLLQKRQARKYHSGGLWTNSACGHPRPGEAVDAAALRRLQEEMGFACKLERLGAIEYRATLDSGMIEHEMAHVFRGIYDGVIAPNPAEADGYQWASLEAIRADIEARPENFSVWFREYMNAQWPMALALPGQCGNGHSQG
ncbi:isopentenyl-diphosphate Delta-isomerase [Methyloligella sp. GL2]|nr:isopentenyl-diphosphate Delta-isomerase [Methyloligella sp. GL2]